MNKKLIMGGVSFAIVLTSSLAFVSLSNESSGKTDSLTPQEEAQRTEVQDVQITAPDSAVETSTTTTMTPASLAPAAQPSENNVDKGLASTTIPTLPPLLSFHYDQGPIPHIDVYPLPPPQIVFGDDPCCTTTTTSSPTTLAPSTSTTVDSGPESQ